MSQLEPPMAVTQPVENKRFHWSKRISKRSRKRLRKVMKDAAASTPARLTLVVFTALIMVFTILLWLPISHAQGEHTHFVDALFTAMSAVCVTGLITVDTATHWSNFGLVVLMFAMKIGGLGVLTLASLLGLSVSRHMGLAQKIITASETKAEKLAEVKGVLKTIVITATAAELLTFLFITPNLIWRSGDLGQGLFHGLFYALSAFNNAGFVPEAAGVEQYVSDPWFSIPVTTAVFVGALGFPVILVVVRSWKHPSKWTLHAKLTLATSAILLVVGMLGFMLMEWSNPATLGPHDFGTKIMASAFAAVMPRSGGLATLDVSQYNPETWLLVDLLMFIGGGSGSTGGGIKVTTFALLVLSIFAEARGDRDVEIFHRRIPQETIRQAIGVLVISAAVIFVATWLMVKLTPYPLDRTIFEVLSAYGTVGLSTGITADLPTSAKYVIITCMYVGRIGPMTLGAALALRERARVVRLPAEAPTVG